MLRLSPVRRRRSSCSVPVLRSSSTSFLPRQARRLAATHARPRHLGLWRWREAPPLPAPASPTPHRPCAFPDALLYLLLYDSHISHFYALLYLVFAFRLFENNLCYSLYKMRYFFSNFVQKQNVESENFPINPINVFIGDLQFFFVTGKENLGSSPVSSFPCSVAARWRPAPALLGRHCGIAPFLLPGSAVTSDRQRWAG